MKYDQPKLNVLTDHIGMFERSVPVQRWRAIALLMLTLIVLATGAWEMRMRSLGLRTADIDDGKAYWAVERRKVDAGRRDQVVIVGDSRSGFDNNLDVWQKTSGIRPIQLGYTVSSWERILEDLSKDQRFNGLVVICMADAGFFSARSPHDTEVIDYFSRESLSQRIGHQLSLPLQRVFAFLDSFYTPFVILQRVGFQNQNGLNIVPKLSESFADRQAVAWTRLETDAAYRQYMRQFWGREYLPDRVPDASIRTAIDSIKGFITAIRSRGGEVVLIRPPSAGLVLEHEHSAAPRDKAWDVLVRDTASFGIHFEDYPEMQNLDVVEWSHLSGEDAKKFTRAYVTVLCEKVAWLKAHGATCTPTEYSNSPSKRPASNAQTNGVSLDWNRGLPI